VATAAEKAKQLGAFRVLLERAIERGVNRAMIGASRVSVMKYMVFLAKGVDANAPPGPLGRRSGALSRTVKPVKAKVTGRIVTGGIQAGGSGVAYARIHELGGITGATTARFYLDARPYLRPAVEESLPAIRTEILVEIAKLEKSLGLR
jgi:hypothetical protein